MEPVSQNQMINYHCGHGRQKDIPVPWPEIHHLPAFISIFPWPIFFLPFSLSDHFLPPSSWETTLFFFFLIHCSTLFLCSNTMYYLAFFLIAVSELKMVTFCPIGQTLQALNSAWQVYYLFLFNFLSQMTTLKTQLSSYLRSSSLHPCFWKMTLPYILLRK